MTAFTVGLFLFHMLILLGLVALVGAVCMVVKSLDNLVTLYELSLMQVREREDKQAADVKAMIQREVDRVGEVARRSVTTTTKENRIRKPS